MYFEDLGCNRYRVFKSKSDAKFYGTIVKQEYVSIDMATGRRVTKRLWKANGADGGWKQASKKHFDTREEAGTFLLKEATTPYAKKATHWAKKQGESVTQKARKAGV
jgi:viroplasmin and RNaseH domain-containing protein